MIQRTKKEVEAFVGELWQAASYDHQELSIAVSEDLVTIGISRMYEYVDLEFRHLMQLAEFFDTDNINEDRYHSDGCETCDYGSCYSIDLTIKPTTAKDGKWR